MNRKKIIDAKLKEELACKEERSMRKVELTEEDFLLIIDIKRTIIEHTIALSDKMDEILKRHVVKDHTWKGQIVPFKKKIVG